MNEAQAKLAYQNGDNGHERFVESMEARGFEKLAAVHSGYSEMTMDAIANGYSNTHHTLWALYPANGDFILWGKKKTDMPPYKAAIIGRLDRQIDKGLHKYSMALEDNVELSINERLEHLAEELTDGLQYIEHFKAGKRAMVVALTESITSLTIMAGKKDDKELLKIAQGLNIIAKQLA